MNHTRVITPGPRSLRLRLWATVPLTVAAVALTACGTASGGSDRLQIAGAGTTPSAHTYGFTGQAQLVTVPEGAVAAELTVVGGGGGGGKSSDRSFNRFGRGMKIIGQLPVRAGDRLTLGVGGQGGLALDKMQAPGDGGWALRPEWAGSSGGSAHGGAGSDGSGGGGASVVLLNDEPVVIAAAAGGVGGEASAGIGNLDGGDGGDTVGGDGSFSTLSSDRGGRGASAQLTNLDPKGRSYPADAPFGGAGGGGGGGGVHPGEGGAASFLGGTGGGGGMSYRGGVQALGWTNVPLATDGSISVRWITNGNQLTPTVDLGAGSTTLSPRLDGTPLTATLPDDATGAVTFVGTRDGQPLELGVVPVADGIARLTKLDQALTGGPLDISALYSGDTLYRSGQSSPLRVTVTKPTPTLSLQVGSSTRLAYATGKQIVPLVASMPTDATGTVAFTYTGALDPSITGSLGTADLENGIATLTEVATVLAKGGYTITATYSGDEEYATVTQSKVIGILG